MLAAATWGLNQRVWADGLAPVLGDLNRSVVAIGTYMKTRRPTARLIGTGFAVGDGRHIVTNAHVIAAVGSLAFGERLVAFVGRGRRALPRDLTVLVEDKQNDLALGRIAGPPLPGVALAPGLLPEGRAVAFTGFPIGSILGTYPVVHHGIVSAVVRLPVLTDHNRSRRPRGGFLAYQLDATAYPGHSGSPLFDPATGAVVGVVNSVDNPGSIDRAVTDPSGITFAIPVRYVLVMLQQAGIDRKARP